MAHEGGHGPEHATSSNPGEETVLMPDELPLLAMRDTVLFPSMVASVVAGESRSFELVSDAMKNKRLIAFVMQRTPDRPATELDELHGVGTMGLAHDVTPVGEHALRVVVHGVLRIRILELVRREPFLVARISPAPEHLEDGDEIEALARTVGELFAELVKLMTGAAGAVAFAAEKLEDPRALAHFVAGTLPIPATLCQELLELDSVADKLRRLVGLVKHEISVQRIMREVNADTRAEISKSEREHILHRQLESIQKELGELDPEHAEGHDLRARLSALPLPDEARKEAMRELDRLERTPALSPEHGMIRTYLDWLAKMPWGKFGARTIEVARAREVLDRDHYDLDKVKERLLEYLAVRKLREERRADFADLADDAARTEPILCLVGPPGVGKTSLGQSIARAMGRKFAHQSLGGIHDEAEIRGHRRTYIGAMPGRIAQALCRVEQADPVFMLDEIDKLGVGFHGDPAAALLELLDPAQNRAFVDTYLGVPFDLSKVLFLCTANTTDKIPAVLLDRMEVIQLPGYTEREKVQIAKRHLLPHQRSAHALHEHEVQVPDDTIVETIRDYTREAGVRNLEREIATILRKAARRVGEGAQTPMRIAPGELAELLGPRRFFEEVGERVDRAGVATALSWTPAGGQILFVEAAMVPGSDEHVVLTGMLGSVMRESAEAALTYLRVNAERFGLDGRLRERRVVHVHVPAGAIPKDGPSAGVAILVALASFAVCRPARSDVAVTGEITLRGKVLPVGGIKEKVLAAHRAGIRTLVLPKRNEPDLEDVPADVRDAIRFVLVESVDEVLATALDMHPQPTRAEPPLVRTSWS